MEEGETEKKVTEVKWFECHICNLKEVYDLKSISPNFTPHVSFKEETYVMKDPFTAADKKQFFILGSDCSLCKNPVCQSKNCSIFFQKRYCQKCAWENKTILPQELHSKIKGVN